MFVQTIFMVTILFVLGFGLLTTQFVAARHALQTIATTKARLALDDGLVAAKSAVANAVAAQGTHGPWPQTPQLLFTRPVCATSASECTMSSTTSWRVTGSTTGSQQKASDTAQNLQTVELDEQRVALRVRSEITTVSGQIVSALSRDVTLRVFTSPPYVTEVGTQDSQAADEQVSQGDSGGNRYVSSADLDEPNSSHPDGYHDTALKFSLECHDSAENSDQANAVVDNHPPVGTRADGNDSLPWGTKVGAYETPCEPIYSVQGPPDSAVHSQRGEGSSYSLNEAGVTAHKSWNDGE